MLWLYSVNLSLNFYKPLKMYYEAFSSKFDLIKILLENNPLGITKITNSNKVININYYFSY